MWANRGPQAKSIFGGWERGVPHELRLVFTFLKDCKQIRLCNKDLMWPAEPKMIAIEAFIEEVG